MLFENRVLKRIIILALQPFSGRSPLFSLLVLYTVGRTPWTGDQPVARSLPTHRAIQRQNKRTQTSMPRVGFEPTVPASERAKSVLALDRAASMIGSEESRLLNLRLKKIRFQKAL
jgi:hypothetical protein